MYIQLKDFKIKYKHTNVPRRFPENQKLANWCQMQKSNYKERMKSGNVTIISDERIKLLEELGFIWDLDEFNWNENYKALKKYYQETEDYYHKGNIDKFLKSWTSRQRQAYRNNKLSKDRIEKLESIGFIWDLLINKSA